MQKERVRVYLGGPSRELTRVREAARILEASGYIELTSRWFDNAEEWAGRDELLDDAEQCSRVCANFAAIRRAAIVWILWPETSQSEGAIGEVGFAAAHRWHVGSERQKVVVSGRRVRSSVGTASADLRFLDDGEATRQVLRLATGRTLAATTAGRLQSVRIEARTPSRARVRRVLAQRTGCVVAV